MSLDSRIDELYQLPPDQFTAARNALAKTLKGDEARQVKQLRKPAAVPAAVNQLYWKARMIYQRLMKAGEQLRDAQVAAIEGRRADLRAARDAHRDAVATAARQAVRLAGQSGSPPAADPLARMLEALSLSAERPAAPGRFTELLQPAGFEALSGIQPSARPASSASAAPPSSPAGGQDKPKPASASAGGRSKAESARARAAAEKAARQAAEQKRQAIAAAERALAKAEADRKRAEQDLERARAAETRARDALEQATQAVRRAERELQTAREQT